MHIGRRWVDNIKRDRREKYGVVWTGLFLLRIGSSGGSCEHGNEPSGSTNVGDVIE
jgi:hypothetical protein